MDITKKKKKKKILQMIRIAKSKQMNQMDGQKILLT